MTVLASAVASSNDHGYEGGRYVATQALAAFEQPPALLLACISAQHNVPDVVRGIRSITQAVPLLGTGAGRAITTAGTLTKGVGLLALRADELRVALALAAGALGTPEALSEHALQQAASELPAASSRSAASDGTLLLTAGLTSGAAFDATVQAARAQAGAESPLAGVVSEGLAVALLRGLAVGVGAHDDAAQAAQQAVAGLRGEPAAALIVVGEQPADAAPADDSETLAVTQARAVLGRAVPIVGAEGAGSSAGHGAGTLVCVFGTP
jgi:hypothetical protein